MSLDENLHSRQLALYGREAMLKMADSSVLVCGLRGAGVEIAKNVILAGARQVTLFDDEKVTLKDLSTQFFLTMEDVGTKRAQACVDNLQRLNKSVKVEVFGKGTLTETDVQNFNVIVLTDTSLATSKQVNLQCRKNSVAFIQVQVRGVFASVFSDFGDNFTVYDTTGLEPQQTSILKIIQGYPTQVITCQEERMTIGQDSYVQFTNIQGMVEMNSIDPQLLKVKSVKKNTFAIDIDSTSFGEYTKGGSMKEYKQPEQFAFYSLEECLKNPGQISYLGGRTQRGILPNTLHIAFQAADKFQAEMGSVPTPGNIYHWKKFISMIDEINEVQVENSRVKINEADLLEFLWGIQGDLNPTAAIAGGIAAQEVQKAMAHQFRPLQQWFYFSALESLPNIQNPAKNQCNNTMQINLQEDLMEYWLNQHQNHSSQHQIIEKPLMIKNCTVSDFESGISNDELRYKEQIQIMGKSMQKRLGELRVFLVGAGALGCEFLKNFALMGIACENNGVIFVSDDDIIEKSNLTRQFLFREEHISQSKSFVAAAEVQKINPKISIKPFQIRVNEKSENIFNDQFWQELDIVVNALDNIKARIYVDKKCVQHQKPFLDSGTIGPVCTTQTIIPKLTQNYEDEDHDNRDLYPMCTIRSFPHNIQHCLAWAKNLFDILFLQSPQLVNSYREDPVNFLQDSQTQSDAQSVCQMQQLYEFLTEQTCRSFGGCVMWAQKIFWRIFYADILNLIESHPEDEVVEDCLFWQSPKKFPQVLKFDNKDILHISFIQSAAILNAKLHDINVPSSATNFERFMEIMKNQTDEVPLQCNSQTQTDKAEIGQLIEELQKMSVLDEKLNPIIFEKDDDDNHHIQFIWALANLRARNYQIEEVDKLKAKITVGKIVPAIVTSTAIAAGLVCFELYKVIQQKSKRDYFCSAVHLAALDFLCCEPDSPRLEKFGDLSWSVWDQWEINSDVTVKELINWFDAKGLECFTISWRQKIIFNSCFANQKKNLHFKVSDLAANLVDQTLKQRSNFLCVSVQCVSKIDEEKEIQVPQVKIIFQ